MYREYNVSFLNCIYSQSDPTSLEVNASTATISSATVTMHSTSSSLPTQQRYVMDIQCMENVYILMYAFSRMNHTHLKIYTKMQSFRERYFSGGDP